MIYGYYILLVIVAVTLLIISLNKRKAVRILPYILLFYIEPFFGILNDNVYIKLYYFCQNHGIQLELLNMNQRQLMVYGIGSVLALILGIVVSKDFKNRMFRALYIVTVFLLNITLTLLIYRYSKWY